MFHRLSSLSEAPALIRYRLTVQCTVDVAFKPTAKGKVKKKKGLTFTDSAQKSPQHVVELLGQGVAGATPTPTASATATRTATPTATLPQDLHADADCNSHVDGEHRADSDRDGDCHRDENRNCTPPAPALQRRLRPQDRRRVMC